MEGCICNEYIDEYGHGNCRFTYMGRVGCYVVEPTACLDTIPYDGRHFSLSEACSTGK